MKLLQARMMYGAALALTLSLASASTGAQTLTVRPEDKRLVINGRLGDNVSSFSRHFTVTLTGDGSGPILLKRWRTDLVRKESPQVVIDRGSVEVGDLNVRPNQPQDLKVTVSNVTQPGTYEGKLKLGLPAQAEGQALEIDIVLSVGAKVDVRSPAATGVQVTRCSPLPCAVSGWLPQGLIGGERGLLLDNLTGERVPVLGHDLVLRGEKTGRIVDGNDVTVEVPGGGLAANATVPVALKVVNRDRLEPDKYLGTLRFRMDGLNTPAAVNFTLDVRSSPWYPLLVLLFGVIVGRLVQRMSSPAAVLQLKLMRRWYGLRSVASGLGDSQAREVFLGRLDDVRSRVEVATETEQALTTDLDKIEVGMRLLRRLERLKSQASLLSEPTLRADVQNKASAAVTSVIDGKVEDAEAAVRQIEVLLVQSADEAADDAGAFAEIRILRDSVQDVGDAATAAKEVYDRRPPSDPGLGPRFVAALAGSSLMGVGARFWLWRPIFFLLLLILLVLIGLKSLYIDSGANFGVGGIYDYLGLFMWGLSADIAQRTLQNLQLPKA